MTLVQLRTSKEQRCCRCDRRIPEKTIAEVAFNKDYSVYYHPSCAADDPALVSVGVA
jgi:hypothetical protein